MPGGVASFESGDGGGVIGCSVGIRGAGGGGGKGDVDDGWAGDGIGRGVEATFLRSWILAL